MSALGKRVRALRERIGVNQTELAFAAGISRAALSNLEAGSARHGVTLTTLAALAEALDVPVGVLLGERPLPVHWPVDGVFWRQAGREIDQLRAFAEAQAKEVA